MHESVFISYSSEDEVFVERLYQKLIQNGVSCWYAPINAQPGKKTHDQILQAIESQDRLLLVLSHSSMQSRWVQTEISLVRSIEVREQRQKLFPISIVPYGEIQDWALFDDDIGLDSAKEIRGYSIPDFSGWTNEGDFKVQFDKLLLALWRSAPDRTVGENFLIKELPALVNRWNQNNDDAYIATMDVDGMTQINDVHGAAIGNSVLSTSTKLLEKREGVLHSGRFGDDTFFATTTIGHGRNHRSKAVRFAESLLKLISEHPWNDLHTKLRVTCSIGIARLTQQNPSSAITAAVLGYIEAKKMGGNQMRYAGPRYIKPNVPGKHPPPSPSIPEWRKHVS